LVLEAFLLYGLITTDAILSSDLIIYAMRKRHKTAKKPSEKDQPKKPLNPRANTHKSKAYLRRDQLFIYDSFVV
jgi:hypothetical protein